MFMNRQQFDHKNKQRLDLFHSMFKAIFNPAQGNSSSVKLINTLSLSVIPLTLSLVQLGLLAGPLKAEENTDSETFDKLRDSDQFQEPDAADLLHQPAIEADLRPGPAADFSDSAASSDFSDDNASKLLKIKFSSPRNKRGELFPSCQLKTCKLNKQQLASLSTTKVDWPTYGYDVQRTGYNPNEHTLGVNNVGNLHELWTFKLGAVTVSQPVYASNVNVNGRNTDVIYTGSENGYFYALNATTGNKIWSRKLGAELTTCDDLPGGVFGVSSTAALERSKNCVYVAGGDGNAYALDMSNGAIVPGWPVNLVDPSLLHVYGAINIFNGKLYAVTAGYCDHNKYRGTTVEVDTTTAKLTKQFFPTGAFGPIGGGIWGYGGASVDPNSTNPGPGNVYVAVGNAFANPESYGYADQVVSLDSSLHVIAANYPGLTTAVSDVGFGATPLLFQAPSICRRSLLAAENKSGVLFIYDRYNVQAGPLQRLQLASLKEANAGQFIGLPAFSPVTKMIYVSNTSDSSSGTYKHGMVALKVQSNCNVALAWQTTVAGIPNAITPYSSPTVANGVVYHGNGYGNHVFAYNASQGNQLWSSPNFSGAVYAPPTVVNGRLYVGAWDKKLHAFGP